jgi:hypothetical protein
VLLIIAFPDYKTNTDIARKLNITPCLDKMQDHRRNWIQQSNRVPRNWFPKIIKNYRKRQNEPGKTTDETTECMRTEQVN